MTKKDISITYENNVFYCTKNGTKWISVDGEKWYVEEKQIAELEAQIERLKGDLELWESGGCRATNLFKCGVVKELKEQLFKAKKIIKALLRLWNNVMTEETVKALIAKEEK